MAQLAKALQIELTQIKEGGKFYFHERLHRSIHGLSQFHHNTWLLQIEFLGDHVFLHCLPTSLQLRRYLWIHTPHRQRLHWIYQALFLA